MLKKEVRDHIRKYVHPFRITNGQGFGHCKTEKGEVAELLSQGTASRTAPSMAHLGRNACYFAA